MSLFGLVLCPTELFFLKIKIQSSLPIRPATKAEQMRECLRTLKQNNKVSFKFCYGLRVNRTMLVLHFWIDEFYILMNNILQNSEEEKFLSKIISLSLYIVKRTSLIYHTCIWQSMFLSNGNVGYGAISLQFKQLGYILFLYWWFLLIIVSFWHYMFLFRLSYELLHSWLTRMMKPKWRQLSIRSWLLQRMSQQIQMRRNSAKLDSPMLIFRCTLLNLSLDSDNMGYISPLTEFHCTGRSYTSIHVFSLLVTINPNSTWQDRVGKLKGGVEFLELCGFEKIEGGEFLYLPREKVDMPVLHSAGSELNSAINNPFFGVLWSTAHLF